MSERTVRTVLAEWLQGYVGHDDQLDGEVSSLLRDLAEVLSTGPGWVTREIEADALQAGDVIVAKDGRLWSVASVGYDATGSAHEITRAGRTRPLVCPSDRMIPTLLTRDDARALAILERELGTEVVGRVVA